MNNRNIISNKIKDFLIDGDVNKKIWRATKPIYLVDSVTGKSVKVKTNIFPGRWTVEAAIPWQELIPRGKIISNIPFWRINFFRIDGWPKQTDFLSSAPTFKNPPDFHVPGKFVLLELSF